MLAGDLANNSETWTDDLKACKWALGLADNLIKMERETQRKDHKEDVLWMTEEPKILQIVCHVDTRNQKKYFKAPWYRSEFDVASFESNQVFDCEAKIRKFLKLD